MSHAVRTLVWVGSGLAALSAIIIVAHRPAPTTIEPPHTDAAHPGPPVPREDPPPRKRTEVDTQRFIQKAHQDALDTLIKDIEAQMPSVAAWALLRAKHDIAAPPYRPWFGIAGPARAPAAWEEFRRRLGQIKQDQLDPRREILFKTASFLIDETMAAPRRADPMAVTRRLSRIFDDLIVRWAVGDRAQSFAPVLEQAGHELQTLQPSEQMRFDTRRELRAQLAALDARVQRWQGPALQDWLDPTWQRSFTALREGLKSYQGKLPRRADPDTPPPSAEQWTEWMRWELGRSADPALTRKAIDQSANRLRAIQSAALPRPAPQVSLGVTQARCIARRDELKTRLDERAGWAPAEIDCTRLLALHRFPNMDALTSTLLVAGWIEPTRNGIRRRQRPLVAGVGSSFGGTAQANMRQIMALDPLRKAPASAAEQAWVGRRLHKVLDAMLEELCATRRLLDKIEPDPASEPSDSPCRGRYGAHPYLDPYSAVLGARLSAMPTTIAVMAGLDRFYWGPTRVALYWATPDGVDPDAFGQAPPSQPSPLPTTVTPLSRDANARPPARNP